MLTKCFYYCKVFIKVISKGIFATVVYPIATIISFPKMLMIYFDPEIQSRHFTIINRSDILRRLLPRYFSLPPEATIQRMKNKMIAKYKISVSYLRLQVGHHILYALGFSALGILDLLFLSTDLIANAKDSSNRSSTNHLELWATGGKVMLFISSFSTFCQTIILHNQKNSYLSSAVDEISSLLQCYRKNRKLYIDPFILKANLKLNALQRANLLLLKTPRPLLHQELILKAQNINTTRQFLSKTLSENNPLPNEINDIILEYSFPTSLLFSEGKHNSLMKFEKFLKSNQKVILQDEELLQNLGELETTDNSNFSGDNINFSLTQEEIIINVHSNDDNDNNDEKFLLSEHYTETKRAQNTNILRI